MIKASSYNPDILTCLANLSSDEVFTPPRIANDILDQLPADIWSDRNARFLDPVAKSGVFLREITRRLDKGLSEQIPDQQKRVNHVLQNQVFALAITELTALLSRRSAYCSKTANGKYSICDQFEDEQGNIVFRGIQHTWKDGKCKFCGAGASNFEREDVLENHAYEFIHHEKPQEIFNMKFDVIIGNPPYQLNDGGHGRSASPIYHHFVEQAKKLNPRYLSMIIPSRWFAGGKGLNEFRSTMLSDEQLRVLVDFEDASECFPGVDLAGGVCYFLWEKDSSGPCEVVNVHNGAESRIIRPLNEFEKFVRHSQAVPVIRKILAKTESFMNSQVTSRKPFGLETTVRPMENGDLTLVWQKGTGPYPRDSITVGKDLIDEWNVITSYVAYDHAGNPGKDGRRKVFSKIEILPPGSICTETYLVVGSYKNKCHAENLIKYMKTKFFRFLVAQFMYSHHITKESYAYVPLLDMNTAWSDQQLFDEFGFSESEIEFVDSKIREME